MLWVMDQCGLVGTGKVLDSLDMALRFAPTAASCKIRAGRRASEWESIVIARC